jgi:hypothetical protein
MGKRAKGQMVDENDPQFSRFWAMYPNRVGKKDARKAWAELSPGPAMVDRICEALDWQVIQWRQQGDWYTPPYPASYLRAERFDDERPRAMKKPQAGAAAMTVLETLLGEGTDG